MSIAILALSELFSGCACALTLPSPASFRRVSDKRSALDLLDNVFLLHFALETAQCILEGLALLQSDLCQPNNTPKLVQMDSIVIASFCTQVKRYVGSRSVWLLV